MKEKDFILILGTGKTGQSVARFLSSKNENILLFDDKIENAKNIQNQFKNATILENINKLNEFKIKFAITSPGIRTIFNSNPIIKALKEMNIKIKSDYDLMMEILPKETKIIAITGTNGKSTTTALINFCLNRLGGKSIACGNIGISPLDCNLLDLNYICLECSSYQLEISNLEPYCGIFLNFTQDHLDHHGSMKEYLRCKAKIFHKNKISLIDDSIDSNLMEVENCNFIKISIKNLLKNGFSFINNCYYQDEKEIKFEKKPKLLGIHNTQNILATIGFLVKEGFEINKIMDAICDFEGLPHRMELIKKIGNISFINDSKATNPDSAKQSISCFDEIYLIAGGISKYKGSIKNILDLKSRIKKVFLIGESANEFHNDLNNEIKNEISNEMKIAIRSAYKSALQDLKNKIVKNPVILLAPLCASMDQYKNFEERGDHFRNLILEL